MCLAVPSKIVSITDQLGKVDIGGVIKEVNLCLLEDAQVGDYVIIHAGYAIQRIDEDEAQVTLQLFREMAELESQDAPAEI